ncbi:hypothetical protein JKP88DRAFT_287900 [Tribonema minus]|uniref:Uncharacterized protein n=1 Tax=Tribonema minus TaxID=303371 RepID=A0A835Z7B8_9STRA|nr:hypothetical protein JKP88DRAFT_287900 [Tribonema minus]
MRYYHLHLLHDGAGTATITSDADALSMSHLNWNSKMTPIMAKPFFEFQASMPAQAPVLTSASTYTVAEGEVLAVITDMECKKIGAESAKYPAPTTVTCCLHLMLSTTVLKLNREQLITLIESQDGTAIFDESWEVRLGTWNITALEGAHVKTRRQIEDETELVIYTTPGLVEHNVGGSTAFNCSYDNVSAWQCLEPRMRFGIRWGECVDALALGSCLHGGTGGQLQEFTTDGIIETIGGTADAVINSLYFGTRAKDGCKVTPRLGGTRGYSFCWDPPSVGRIYAVRVWTGRYKGAVVVMKLSILSEM